jgi:hypothetical protein
MPAPSTTIPRPPARSAPPAIARLGDPAIQIGNLPKP